MRKYFPLFLIGLIIISALIIYFGILEYQTPNDELLNNNGKTNITETNATLNDLDEGFEQEKISIDKLSDAVTLIKLPYNMYTRPSLMNDQLYLPVNVKSESINKILKYDLITNKTNFIFESTFKDSAINNVMANENWLTWENSDIMGQNSAIYAENMKTNETKKLFQTDADIVKVNAPYLYSDFISWVNVNGGKPEVAIYDLKKNEQKTIAKINLFSLYNNFLHINNNKLVWTDSKEGNGFYHVYDLIKMTTKSYKAPHPFPGYAQIIDNNIFSINFEDAKRWVNQTFGYFNLASEQFTPVDVGTSYINRFVVGKNHVAVIDAEQKLHVYAIQNNQLHKIDLPDVRPQADTIDFSQNGELIAGYTENQTIFLYIIKLK